MLAHQCIFKDMLPFPSSEESLSPPFQPSILSLVSFFKLCSQSWPTINLPFVPSSGPPYGRITLEAPYPLSMFDLPGCGEPHKAAFFTSFDDFCGQYPRLARSLGPRNGKVRPPGRLGAEGEVSLLY